MNARKRNNQFINNLSFDMEEVPMLGFQSPMPACLFVDMLNSIYELELEYRCGLYVPMPEERPLGLPDWVEASMYDYEDSQRHQFYILVQMPRFKAVQGELFPTDPILNLDKLLFLHGEEAFERIEWLHNDIAERPKPQEVDICDLRTAERLRMRESLGRDHIRIVQPFDFRPKREEGEENPWLNMVVKTKGKASRTSKGKAKMRTFSDPMAQLGQHLLSSVDSYYGELSRQEKELRTSLFDK